MGTACACAAVTGTKGETITWTRAGSAYCTKEGLATTGLTTTSMVLCSSNLPRIESDGTGVLGPLVESARTNVLLQSEAFDNAAWLVQATGAAAPTVTADQAVTPWGTTTAERIQFPATATAQESIKYQASTVGQPVSCFVYVKGVSAGGTLGLFINNGTTGLSQPCAYLSTSWTECKISHASGSAANFIIGNESTAFFGGVAAPANDVYVAGGQCEAAAYSTSYIATTTVAVARAKDNDSFNASTFPAVAYSKAASLNAPWSSANGPALPSLITAEISSTSGTDFFIAGGGLRIQNLSTGAFSATTGTLSIIAGTPMRLAGSSSGGFVSHYKNGALFFGPTALTMAAAPNSTGAAFADDTVGTSHLDGIISNICWDADPARCR